MRRSNYDVPTEVRHSARRVIGSPRPTEVRTKRPGGRGGAKRFKFVESSTLPHSDMLHLTEARPDEFIEGAPRMVSSTQAFGHNPVSIKQRPTYHEKAPCLQYSQEVIQHLNVLRAQGGDASVRAYLATLKEKTMSHSLEMVEAGMRRNETPPVSEVVTGTMEAALHDAETKMKFYEAEARRCSAERERWEQVAAGLKQVMALTAQPLATVKRMNGNGHANGNGNGHTGFGFWNDKFQAILTAPMTSKELTDKLEEATGKPRSAIQMAVSVRKRGGQIVEIDGKLCLPQWTDPNTQAS